MGGMCDVCSTVPSVHVLVHQEDSRHTHHVQLIVSGVLDFVGVPIIGYHTSVVIDGFEFAFNLHGVCKSTTICSHGPRKTKVLDLGFSVKSGGELSRVLSPHFLRGSYDILLKNCNSYSDCAIFFLLGTRLDDRYSATEKYLRQNIGLEHFQMMTHGLYQPNLNAMNFLVEDVITILHTFDH